jgi:ATP/maltotriose-dependent transcriptional regulator MalT/DNA-binding SARP family transcriptional activator
MAVSTLQRFPRSKIELPQAPQALIVRDRLFPLLDDQAVVLLVAPAGSGKSSLLASWADARRIEASRANSSPMQAFAWYTIDPSDREPARFVDGVAAAIEVAAPGRGLPARKLLSEGVGTYGALATLMAELEDLPEATLILDNCHHIEGARAAEAVLEHFTRHRPPNVRLIFASRGIPLLPALSAIATGKLRTIGRDDLQFTAQEASQLLLRHGLDDSHAERLVRSTRGWAMGLLLQAHAGADSISFMQRPLDVMAEYLMSQVVDRLDDDTRTFVVESALLGAFDAASSNAILGRTDSESRIDVLIRQGLFLDTYSGGSGTVVRYHDLFAEALSESLRRTSHARFEAIHLQAAAYHQEDPHIALAHCAKLSDPSVLATELVRVLPLLHRLGHWEAVIQYGTLIPAQHRPALLLRVLSYSYYVRGDDAAAIEAASAAYELAISLQDYESKYSALAMRANSMLRQDRSAEILEYCLPALAEAHVTGPAGAEGWLAEIAAKCLLREGRLSEARRLAEEGRALHRSRGGASGLIGVAWLDQELAPLLLEIGELHEAEALLSAAIQVAGDHDARALATYCKSTRTEALLLRGETGAALALAEQMSDVALREGNVIARYTALRVQARALAQLGRTKEAIEVQQRYSGVVANWPAPVRVSAELTRAYVSVYAGEYEHARQALDAAAALGVSPRAAGFLALEAGALALAEARYRDADQWLTDAAATLKHYVLRPGLARANVLRAHALTRLGRERPAIDCLAEAAALPGQSKWQAGLRADAGLAEESLRTLGVHWRLQGKGRDLVDSLLQHPTQAVRLVRPDRPLEQDVGAKRKEHAPIVEGLTRASPIRFSPFGESYLSRGESVVPLARLGGDKAREMLAFAILQARPLNRDEILEALWDGAADDTTLAAFHKSVYQIRRFLGHDAWQRIDGAYRITQSVDDDYRRLLTLAVSVDESDVTPADVANLAAQGLRLYQGPYLAWCYSDWAEAPRSMAKTAIVTIIKALAGARQHLGQNAAALEAAEQGLAIEPTSEPLRLAQMRLLVELGRPAEAVESYRRHLQLLVDEDLGAPSAEMRGLVREIRA